MGPGHNLIEFPAVGKVRLLRHRPAADILVDGDQFQLRQPVEIGLGGVLRLHRTIVMPGDRGLCFRRVEEVEIGLSSLSLVLRVYIAIHQRDRRLR